MTANRAVAASPLARIAPPALGLVYVLAWAIGLSVGPASADVTASASRVVHGYLAQSGGAIASYVMTEGLAALALAGVVILLHRAARPRGVGTAMLVAGLAAAIVSVAQCCVGVLVVAWIAPAGHVTLSATLIDLISRVDGAKMLILAVMAVAAIPVVRARVLPAPSPIRRAPRPGPGRIRDRLPSPPRLADGGGLRLTAAPHPLDPGGRHRPRLEGRAGVTARRRRGPDGPPAPPALPHQLVWEPSSRCSCGGSQYSKGCSASASSSMVTPSPGAVGSGYAEPSSRTMVGNRSAG